MSRIVGLFAAGLLLGLAAMGTATPAAAQVTDPACQTLTDFVAATRPNLPQPIDDITEVTDMLVDCDSDVLTFVLRFIVPAEQLPANAVDAARAAFLVGSCQQGIAEATGWTLAGEFRAPDGTVTDRFDTTAADCANVAATAPDQVAGYVADVAQAFPAPLMLDDTLEIAAAQADGTTLVLVVHVSGVLADPETLTADLGSRLVPVLCTTSQVSALFRIGAAIRLSVVDDAGREALTLPLDESVCEAAFAMAGAGAADPQLAALCAAAEDVVAEIRAALPIANNDGTQTTAAAFDCASGTIAMTAVFTGPTDLYAGTALAERDTEHDVRYCRLDALAAGLMMTVTTQVLGVDGAPLATLTTTPSECNFVTPAMVAAVLPTLPPAALAAQLAAIAEANAPTLPARINDMLSLVNIFNGPTVLVLFYQIEGTLVPEQTAAFAAQIREQILAGDCQDPNQLQLLRSGATITYRYSDTSANGLFTINVTAADCGI
ncbi:MAG: hypothetical protein KIS68_06230 [Bauldia sp.]|nr:hypothetical protein [Bauldia sp.]